MLLGLGCRPCAVVVSLGRITKRGDTYLRTLLIQGAKSAVLSVDKRDDATSLSHRKAAGS